jgi:hypothetical protein
LRWQPCGLAAHGRRGGVPMKRSERRWPESLPGALHHRLRATRGERRAALADKHER